MAGASNVKDSCVKLAAFLEDQRVPPVVIEFMMRSLEAEEPGLGLESKADLASLFTEAGFETEVNTMVLEKTTMAGIPVVASRLRNAYRLAKSEMDKVTEGVRKGTTTELDWDTPLDEIDERERKTEFDAAYDELVFEPEATPGQPIVGRMYREFKASKRQVSVQELRKMHSEAGYRTTEGAKHKALGEDISITYRAPVDLPDRRFKHTLDVMQAVKLMTNSWAMAGAHKVESKTHWDHEANAYRQVREVHLTQSMGYYDFVFEKALEHPGPEQATVSWLLDRDRKTRAKARNMFAQFWPFGEALQACRDTHCLVLWTVGGTGLTKQPTPVMPLDDQHDRDVDMGDGPPAARPKKQRFTRSQRKRYQAEQRGEGGLALPPKQQAGNQQRRGGPQVGQRRPWQQQQQQPQQQQRQRQR